MTSTPPASTLRDGNLKASIWQNEGERGTYYSTTFSKTYKDEQGQFQETQSFSQNDLLRISELARQAHHEASVLRQVERSQSQNAVADHVERVKQRLQDDRSRSNSREHDI